MNGLTRRRMTCRQRQFHYRTSLTNSRLAHSGFDHMMWMTRFCLSQRSASPTPVDVQRRREQFLTQMTSPHKENCGGLAISRHISIPSREIIERPLLFWPIRRDTIQVFKKLSDAQVDRVTLHSLDVVNQKSDFRPFWRLSCIVARLVAPGMVGPNQRR